MAATFPYKTSFWATETEPPYVPAPRGDHRADVAIVGAGYAGLSSAYCLKEAVPSLDIILLEAEKVGFGPSGRNFGVAMPTVTEADTVLIKRHGLDRARFATEYLLAQLRWIEELLEREHIDCEYHRSPTIMAAFDAEQMDSLKRVAERYTQLGTPFEFLSKAEMRDVMSYPSLGGLALTANALVQPYRLVRGLRDAVIRRGVRLFEKTHVISIDIGDILSLKTADGFCIETPKAVFATNAYSDRFPSLRGLMNPTHTHVIATDRLDPVCYEKLGFRKYECVLDASSPEELGDNHLSYYYTRVYERRLLLGGGNYLTPSKVDSSEDRNTAEYIRIREEMVRRFPCLENVRLAAAWGGPIDLAPDGMPIIRRLSEAPNVIVNIGYSGYGIVRGISSGQMVKGLVLGDGYVDSVAEKVRKIYLGDAAL